MRSGSKRNLALAGLLPGVLLACLTVPAVAQAAGTSHQASGFAHPYDAKREIKFDGTVKQVVTKHAPGSPAGMHLIVTASTGTVDVHVGPLMPKDVLQALHPGLPIQIAGAVETMNGKSFLLARQLTFDGRTVTVRSRTGFLVGTPSARMVALRAQKPTPHVSGGAQ
jgi:hypothetical protein